MSCPALDGVEDVEELAGSRVRPQRLDAQPCRNRSARSDSLGDVARNSTHCGPTIRTGISVAPTLEQPQPVAAVVEVEPLRPEMTHFECGVGEESAVKLRM